MKVMERPLEVTNVSRFLLVPHYILLRTLHGVACLPDLCGFGFQNEPTPSGAHTTLLFGERDHLLYYIYDTQVFRSHTL